MSSGLNKHESYSFNPFRIDSKHIRRIPVTDDGVTIGHQYADFQEHVRIFPEMHDDLEQISNMALKILVYIFSNIKNGSDEVYFDMDDFIRFTNRGKVGEVERKDIRNKAGIYRGIGDLLGRDIIARKAGDVKTFYINPAKFFAGKRGEWFKKCKDIPADRRNILIDRRINGQKGAW